MTAQPSPRQVLLDLADRCEREEPSRELDTKIGQWFAHNAYEWWRERTGGFNFTSSLDAAVTLVAEGFYWSIDYDSNALVVGPEDNSGRVPVGISSKAESLVPAIALCAAALRARAEAL